MARAVTRPDVVYGAPLNVRTPGKFALLGPTSPHAPTDKGSNGPDGPAAELVCVPCTVVLFFLLRASICAQAFWAFLVSLKGMFLAG